MTRSNDKLKAEVMRLAQSGRHLTTRQAAIYVGLTERTLETYRDIGKPPRFIKIDQHVRYPITFLDEYLRASTQGCATPCHAKLHHNDAMQIESSHAQTNQEIR